VKRLVYYTVAGTVLTLAIQWLGGGQGLAFLAALLVPPLVLLGLFVRRWRSVDRRTRHAYWTDRRTPKP
jgi:hypothetical protein